MTLWVAVLCLSFNIDFGIGQLLTTQCDHIPTDNIIPIFELRKYTFSPTNGIRAWLKCNWNFKSESGSSFVISIQIINVGPMNDFKVIGDFLYVLTSILGIVEVASVTVTINQNIMPISYKDEEVIYEHRVKTFEPQVITTPTNSITIAFKSGFASIKGAGIKIELIAIRTLENKHRFVATPESQLLISPGLTSVSSERYVKWNIKADDCATGIQVAILFMNLVKDYTKNECVDKMILKTNAKTITLCDERVFEPKDGFFYFHSTELEVTFTSQSFLSNRGFVVKFRSNSRTRLKPVENMNYYTSIKKDQDGFDERFIDNYRGRGVFATWPYEVGDFLLEYTTLPFLTEEPPYSIYLFEVHHNGTDLWLNPTKEDGTYGRLLNDNIVKPNVVAETDTDYNNKPRLCFYALEKINIGDELTFHYGAAEFPWRPVTEEENEEMESDENSE